jgi:hypothetical protein
MILPGAFSAGTWRSKYPVKPLCKWVLLVLLIAGCRKTTGPGDNYYTMGPLYSIPEEFKAWTIFRPGSYWIYLNEITFSQDSTVFKHGPYYQVDTCYNCPVEQRMWFWVRSPFLTGFYALGGPGGNASLNVSSTYTNDLGLTDKCLDDPLHADTSYYSYYSFSFVEKVDTMILGTNIFSNVIHTRINWTNGYANHSKLTCDYYWARGIGMIKTRRNYGDADTTWSLVTWKTVQ